MSIIIVGVGPAEFEGELGLGDTREGEGKHRQRCPGGMDGVSVCGVTPLMFGDTGCHLPAMEELDGDEVRVSSRGRYAERDIVQVTGALSPLPRWVGNAPRSHRAVPSRAARFSPLKFVPFRDYVDDSGNQVLSMARLAKDVLAEIPEQLLSYMKTRDIKPRRADPQ